MILTDFLLARIVEDEKAFRWGRLTQDSDDPGYDVLRWDDARGRAELEAKRRIVNRHSRCGTGAGYCDDGGHGWDEGDGPGCADLADLALPYADHPDYDERWRP